MHYDTPLKIINIVSSHFIIHCGIMCYFLLGQVEIYLNSGVFFFCLFFVFVLDFIIYTLIELLSHNTLFSYQ